MADGRHRNTRRSKYRPRTELQKLRRIELREARNEVRKSGPSVDEQALLQARLDELETALRDWGRTGVHARRHTRPLEEIVDDAERFGVLKARVERLETLWAIDRRKRETRAKIIIGGALIAEVTSDTGDQIIPISALLMVLGRRIFNARDRLAVREILGGAPLPSPVGDGFLETEFEAAFPIVEPDFDALVQAAMGDEARPEQSNINAGGAKLDKTWRG